MTVIVGEANAVHSFVVRSTILWNMVVPLGNTTLACNSSRMFTEHLMLHWKKCRGFTGLNANETGWMNTRVTETTGAKRVDVSVWELKGMNLVGTFRGPFELCVVVKRHVAKFLFDIPTKPLLCGGSEGASLLSEVLHITLCQITT